MGIPKDKSPLGSAQRGGYVNPEVSIAPDSLIQKPMSIAEIRSVPLRDKFQILEAIWQDLSSQVDRVELPPAEWELLDRWIEKICNGDSSHTGCLKAG